MYIQWSTDNVDHNLAILDGKETFHGIGILVAVTPSGSFSQLTQITRLKKEKLVAEIFKDEECQSLIPMVPQHWKALRRLVL